ncbi:PH domain-containing protein [Actinomycetota bacterium]
MPRRRHSELDRYLLDGERVVTAVHQHWAKVAEPVASAVAATIAAFWVDINVPVTAGFIANAAWLGWMVVLARTVYRLLEWRHDWFVATDKRLLKFYGFITRKVSMMPLAKVTDMSYGRSIPGRLMGYGTFILESAGQDQALREIHFVPEPDRTYRAICAEIFGIDGDEDELEGGEPAADRYDDGYDEGYGDDDTGNGRGPRRGGPGGSGPGTPAGPSPTSPRSAVDDHWDDGTWESPVAERIRPAAPHSASRDGWERPGSGRRARGAARGRRTEGRTDVATPPSGIRIRHSGGDEEALYRSPDLVRADDQADTGEIPLYPPTDWK